MDTSPNARGSCGPSCGCDTSRREFLQVLGGISLASLARPLAAIAGPFEAKDFDQLVPREKKLSAEWLKSLVERGAPEVYRGAELRFVGMPVGGIGCGQLYLGGDGRLWYWDIFRPNSSASSSDNIWQGQHYEFPIDTTDPEVVAGPARRPPRGEAMVRHGFALEVKQGGKSVRRALDHQGFSDIAFRGEYPIGRVTYKDDAVPVEVSLEAFSPFIPLDLDDSTLPVTILSYTVKNASAEPQDVRLVGWLENPVCRHGDGGLGLTRTSKVARSAAGTSIVHGALFQKPAESARPEIVVEDWSKPTYEGWTVEGTAFGKGPIRKAEIPQYQGDLGSPGDRVVNSHATAPGQAVEERDRATGKLTSRPFPIERNFLDLWVGGGNHAGKTCVNVVVDGKTVHSVTGRANNRMDRALIDLRAHAGRSAVLEIVDAETGPWGNIGVGPIVQTDTAVAAKPEEIPGYGSIALSVLDPKSAARLAPTVAGWSALDGLFQAFDAPSDKEQIKIDGADTPVGALARTLRLEPGQQATTSFVLSWWFPYYPNLPGEMATIEGIAHLKRRYARRFDGASAVAEYVLGNFDRLAGDTRRWVSTWYDSTLPYWLLDRAMIPVDCLATQTLHGFDNGRWWGWEGVDCCAGTCQHVWQYGQAAARLFPEFERDMRERVDFGLAWRDNGAMDYRGENAREVAHDGFCGTIIRAYREHQTAADSGYLQRVWPRVKTSVEFILAQDADSDGLLEGVQMNTLDAAWEGPMGWISSLFLGALAAGAAMADDMGDAAFAALCRQRVQAGKDSLVAKVYDGEYFIHHPPNFERTNTNLGCHIDQVMGQSLALQVGLPRVVPEAECRSALEALWKYNFTPDVGLYRKAPPVPGGRWYAMPGEGGLLMCTWPKGGAEHAPGRGNATFVGYFNECMNGFEYQVASHMVWEGSARADEPGHDLVEKGLAVTRMVHDRYAAALRNPYNEIECSDHYARSMASYGVFLAACGFSYHGPNGYMAFAPRISPENFRAPFTASEGWGTFSQQVVGNELRARLKLAWGRLALQTIGLVGPPDRPLASVRLRQDGRLVVASVAQIGTQTAVTLPDGFELQAGEELELILE